MEPEMRIFLFPLMMNDLSSYETLAITGEEAKNKKAINSIALIPTIFKSEAMASSSLREREREGGFEFSLLNSNFQKCFGCIAVENREKKQKKQLKEEEP